MNKLLNIIISLLLPSQLVLARPVFKNINTYNETIGKKHMANQLNGHDIIDKAGNCYDALYENLNKTFKEITINSLEYVKNTPKWIGEHIYQKYVNPAHYLDPLASM